MPTVIETTVFTFDELTEAAKERAREWYREGQRGEDQSLCAQGCRIV